MNINNNKESEKKMKKNKKNTYVVESPNIVSMDSLAEANDLDLDARNSFLKSGLEKAERSGQDSRTWEVELAYLQRERDIRKTRQKLHEAYFARNPDLFGDRDHYHHTGTNNGNVDEQDDNFVE